VQKDLDTRQGIPSELVYNGIDVDSIRQKKFLPKEERFFRILQISRLVHEKKGQDLLLMAFIRFKQENPEVRVSLDFIGSGPSRGYLQRLCVEHELELGKEVCFLGEKDRACIYNSIADYDLLVQPSRYEGFGLTVLEGLAAKVPVLSSDNDGPEEILQAGKHGFLFENGNIDDCFRQLKAIYSRYNSLEPALEDNYEYVKKNFDINRTVRMYLSVYKKVLKK
jgi:glycosyltransferase involved in cell wall biosynthesis